MKQEWPMREQVARLEINTIQPIALDQRHGTARDLFTVWFGSNIMLLTIVTGGLAVTVFALPFTAGRTGSRARAIWSARMFMALHAAQGPTLGRAADGANPRTIRLLGLAAGGRHRHRHVRGLSGVEPGVWAAQALASLVPGLSDTPGIVLVGVFSVIAAIYGYDLIHAYTRVMTLHLGRGAAAHRSVGSSGCTACRRIS